MHQINTRYRMAAVMALFAVSITPIQFTNAKAPSVIRHPSTCQKANLPITPLKRPGKETRGGGRAD